MKEADGRKTATFQTEKTGPPTGSSTAWARGSRWASPHNTQHSCALRTANVVHVSETWLPKTRGAEHWLSGPATAGSWLHNPVPGAHCHASTEPHTCTTTRLHSRQHHKWLRPSEGQQQTATEGKSAREQDEVARAQSTETILESRRHSPRWWQPWREDNEEQETKESGCH